MASLPPQSANAQRRRSSPSDQEAETATSNPFSALPDEAEVPQTSSSEAHSVAVDDAQAEESPSQQVQLQDGEGAKTPSEPRQCWICFDDETEDTPLSSEWRSPCPCALTAHEACLLDWVANLENPKSRSRSQADQILCPQCKNEITVERPRSLILDGVRKVDRALDKMVLPAAAGTVLGTLYAGCLMHGAFTFSVIFGAEDASRMLTATAQKNPSEIYFGLPAIPIALIFSRHHFSDFTLPFSSLLMLAAHLPEGKDFEFVWPPEAPTVFGFLPVVRTIYNISYEKLFGNLERKWIAEVQPRAAERDGAEGAEGGGPVVAGEVEAVEQPVGGNNALGFNFDVEIVVQDEVEEIEQPAAPAGANEPQHEAAEAQGEQPAAQNGEGNAPAAQPQPPQNQILGRHQDDIIIEGSTLASEVFSALILPTVSATMGGALKLALPLAWTTRLGKGRPGLLQTRWGRSVLGGCLFVVLKDMIVLYSRWKLVQTHRRRRILDYDPKRPKPSAARS